MDSSWVAILAGITMLIIFPGVIILSASMTAGDSPFCYQHGFSTVKYGGANFDESLKYCEKLINGTTTLVPFSQLKNQDTHAPILIQYVVINKNGQYELVK